MRLVVRKECKKFKWENLSVRCIKIQFIPIGRKLMSILTFCRMTTSIKICNLLKILFLIHKSKLKFFKNMSSFLDEQLLLHLIIPHLGILPIENIVQCDDKNDREKNTLLQLNKSIEKGPFLWNLINILMGLFNSLS